MNKTKIEWCDYTWNPVTGCLHDCPYCYARGIVKRFGGWRGARYTNSECGVEEWDTGATGETHELVDPCFNDDTDKLAPYPYGFDPTFHRYRLDEPQRVKKPSKIFVCSMADLFGAWVPSEWISAVFDACARAQPHKYLFLTKNSGRLLDMGKRGELEEREDFWFGCTVTKPDDKYFYSNVGGVNTFLSIEPITDNFAFKDNIVGVKWIIVGRDTSNRKDKVIPRREWIENIVSTCRDYNVPVFLKNNLRDIWGADLIQEYPEGLK